MSRLTLFNIMLASLSERSLVSVISGSMSLSLEDRLGFGFEALSLVG
jgi:hypothetical protein